MGGVGPDSPKKEVSMAPVGIGGRDVDGLPGGVPAYCYLECSLILEKKE